MTNQFIVSPPGDEPVVVEGNFAVSAERVFRAWIDPDDMSGWFGSPSHPAQSLELDPRVGGKWQCTFAADDNGQDKLMGQYLVVEPGSQLVFSWIHQRVASDGSVQQSEPSQVTVTFSQTPNGSHIRLVHQKIQTDRGRIGVRSGWENSFGKLAGLLNS